MIMYTCMSLKIVELWGKKGKSALLQKIYFEVIFSKFLNCKNFSHILMQNCVGFAFVSINEMKAFFAFGEDHLFGLLRQPCNWCTYNLGS